MKIYTKTGDRGTTSLVGGTRVGKDDLRVEAYGTVDELAQFLAYLKDNMDTADPALDEFRDDIREIQATLMTLEALLASDEKGLEKVRDVRADEISYLETRCDEMTQEVKPIDRFTLPGGDPLVSLAGICRTVCRRAERAAIRSSREYPASENALAYLNRLSDYLYLLGRRLVGELGVEEEYWEPEK